MTRLALFVLGFLVLLGVGQAFAQPAPPCGGRAGPPCTSSSDEPTSPGDPFIPPRGGGPTIPDPGTTGGIGNLAACNSDLGGLRRVREAAVEAITEDDKVEVIPLCVGKTLGSIQEDVALLHEPIADKPELMAALKAKGYDASQVVGVFVSRPQVVLYVH